MPNIAIKVENLSKAYRIGQKKSRADTLGGALASWVRAPFRNFKKLRNLSQISANSNDADIFWALRDINFEVKHGEVLGIIGKNGAGKSTLLKILSQITEPTTGHIDIHGRVASLLEVGTGFNPELTGRENIYLNGTVLGMTRREIDRKFEEIVDFSGVEKFIDTPVKRYSSGMKVRLAFAVAANLDPEILIIDEVLAVGDAEFQKKCLGKMQEISGINGRTVLFVSHDLAAVKKLCTRAVLLNSGRMVYTASPDEVIHHYLKLSVSNHQSRNIDIERARGDKRFVIDSITLLDNRGNDLISAFCGQDLVLSLKYTAKELGPDPIVLLKIKDNFDKVLFSCLSRNSYSGIMPISNRGTINCIIPKLPLLPGTYTIDIVLKFGQDITFESEGSFAFDVEKDDFFGTGKLNEDLINGIIIYHQWKVNQH